MNGRCQNDLMDFALDVCDSCGDQFCEKCLVHPRGPKAPPFCTNCAMALSGVRNRRPVKPLGRGEIKRRRKALKADLAEKGATEAITMPGTDLINGPELEAQAQAEQEKETGIMSRFRRRKTDRPADGPDDPGELFADQDAVFETTVAGGRRATDPELGDSEPPVFPEGPESESTEQPEHSSATAILNQLRDGDRATEDDVWLPAAESSASPWSLPEMPQQSPLASGPWGAVAASPTPPPTDDTIQESAPPAPAIAPIGDVPMFVTEAELKAQGPKDIDTSGNWVPPILRGMAPAAGSNGAELTRRRRRSDPAAEQPPEPEP